MEQGLEVYLIAADNDIGKKQRRIFKRKRAGKVLTREQVAAIKAGRKLLKKQMKAQGIKEKEDFELTASSMGLYFDKRKWLLLLWFFHGRGLWALLGALAMLLLVLSLFSQVTRQRGNFTINMSDAMFRKGFTLSETEDFRNPTTHLFATPAVDVPCISIVNIPEDVDQQEGTHNATYFAYTFWVRNEGETSVDYAWQININSESQDLSKASWVMVFEDGVMNFYAEADENGQQQALPAFDDDSRGYIGAKLIEYAEKPEEQFQLMAAKGDLMYYRYIPQNFTDESIVTHGTVMEVEPMETHKYTVVIWLEGDDPDCTDAMIGGHVGMDFNIMLLEEHVEGEKGGLGAAWEAIWDALTFQSFKKED